MQKQKVVARFTDGRILKGYLTNFSSSMTHFMIEPAVAGMALKPVPVEMAELKGIFFVRDFDGNKAHKDRDFFIPNQPRLGSEIQVTFKDGEIVVGHTPGYGAEMPGFFIFPADGEANATKIYILAAAVRRVRLMPGPKPPK